MQLHKDHLGSTTVVTDKDGNTLEDFGQPELTQYRPYGQTREGYENRVNTVTDYNFTDQELDNSTGLYNYDARLYNPDIAMFITADSWLPDEYDPQLLNRYVYCRNNPMIYNDPSGHQPNPPEIITEMVQVKDELTNGEGEYIVTGRPDWDEYRARVGQTNLTGEQATGAWGILKKVVGELTRFDEWDAATMNLGRKVGELDGPGPGIADALGGLGALGAVVIHRAAKASKLAESLIKLSGKAKKILGNLSKIKDMDAAEAIIKRGGTGANVRKALGQKLQGKTVGEIANMAAQGDKDAATAIKIIKQASKKGQEY